MARFRPPVVPGIEPCEMRRLLSAGDLDLAFGAGGLVFDPSTAADVVPLIADVARLPNDDILVAGSIGDVIESDLSYLLRRYNADGSIDADFGSGGSVIGKFSGRSTRLERVFPLADGRILVKGHQFTSQGPVSLVARFTSDGALDETFADAGVLVIPNRVTLGLAPDRRLVVDTDNFGIRRYSADGVLDNSFGSSGSAESFLDGLARCVVVQPDGKILLGGALDDEAIRFAIVRLNANGTPDTSFGDTGKVTIDITGGSPTGSQFVSDLIVLPNGRILAMGLSKLRDTGVPGAVPQIGVARFLANGSIDPTFGTDGRTLVELNSYPGRMTLDVDGRIYLCAGGAARLTPDGQLDPTFGIVTASAGIGGTVLSNGTLVLPGKSTRFLPLDRLVMAGFSTADDGNPSPVRLVGNTVVVNGTPGDDIITADDKVALDMRVSGFGRAFERASVDHVRIEAGDGDDIVRLAATRFTRFFVDGGNGSDRIAGGPLNDTLMGGAQRDFIDGGNGADYISGGGGNDQLRGQGGHDRIKAGAGNDYIEGGGGNDRIDGGTGNDTLIGNAGDDMFFARDGMIDLIFGDGGRDSADADADDVLTSIETTV